MRRHERFMEDWFAWASMGAASAYGTITPTSSSVALSGTTVVTIQRTDRNGNNLSTSGGTALLFATAGTFGAVTDVGNGTYTATYTAPSSGSSALITATIAGATLSGTATITLTSSSTVTAYFTATNGRLQSNGATSYANARSGTNLSVEASVNWVGQRNFNGSDIYCYQSAIELDVPSIGAGATVTGFVLHTNLSSRGTEASGKIMEARQYDFGAAPLTAADFLAGGSLSGRPLMGRYTDGGSATGDVAWTDESSAYAQVPLTGGTLRMVLVAKNQTDNVAPATGGDKQEYVDFVAFATSATACYADITYTPA